MFAFHFPPIAVSSGVQRTLKFSSYLPDFGWRASVVTVHPRAYVRTDPGQLRDIHPETRVHRAFALDTSRHLSLFGRYPGFLAYPDRWCTWLPFATLAGVREAKHVQAQCLWSTFPITTAHLAAEAVQRRTGLPWIADFRDSMIEVDYPLDPVVRARLRLVEARIIERATHCVFTTSGTVEMYAERYPAAAERFSVIENAFDEENFSQAQGRTARLHEQPVRLVHAGVVYPRERDPRPFFAALARLRDKNIIDESRLQVVLRATGHDKLHQQSIDDAGVGDMVKLAPPVPYVDALSEMLNADGLLLFQAENCNHQIPAKFYEYLRAKRPVLALTQPEGDTAAALRREGVGTVVPIDDEDAMVTEIPDFLDRLRNGTEPVASDSSIANNTRQARTESLAELMNRIVEIERRQ